MGGITFGADGGVTACEVRNLPHHARQGERPMQDAPDIALYPLDQTDLTVQDPAEDLRGRKVLDRHGEELGTVDQLYIDDRERKVRFLQVASGGFLGIGQSTVLIPIDAITAVTNDEVRIDQSRERVAGAPPYDPTLAQKPSWPDYYGYYGYAPFWGPGYLYPPFPYYGPTGPA
jgi:sporulation protein YlmC with PRC-barrel domain